LGLQGLTISKAFHRFEKNVIEITIMVLQRK